MQVKFSRACRGHRGTRRLLHFFRVDSVVEFGPRIENWKKAHGTQQVSVVLVENDSAGLELFFKIRDGFTAVFAELFEFELNQSEILER